MNEQMTGNMMIDLLSCVLSMKTAGHRVHDSTCVLSMHKCRHDSLDFADFCKALQQALALAVCNRASDHTNN